MKRIKRRINKELGGKPMRNARHIFEEEAEKVIPDPDRLFEAVIVASELITNTNHSKEGSVLIERNDDDRIQLIVVTAPDPCSEPLDCVADEDKEGDDILCHGRGLEIAKALSGDNIQTGSFFGFNYVRVVFSA